MASCLRKLPKRVHHHSDRLRFESLEQRLVMAGIPQLNSLPGAPQTLYLDFDGHFQTEWIGQYRNAAVTSFPKSELIPDIWRIVAEDYAPFNVNVTTSEPSTGSSFQRVAIGNEIKNWYPRWSGGGVGLEGDGTAWVFLNDNQPIGTNVKKLGNTISHEAGHAFGLEHQSAPGKRYHPGGPDWTPIMGDNQQTDRHLWYAGWNEEQEWQNDVDVLFARLGARPDDNVDAGIALTRTGEQVTAKGLINQMDDNDWFSFETTGGMVQLSVITGSSEIGYATNSRNYDGRLSVADANLNVRLRLVAADGRQVGAPFNPQWTLGASLYQHVPAGRYSLVVESEQQFVGDMGLYSIFGTVPYKPAMPTGLQANALSSSEIKLTWKDVALESNYEVVRWDGTRGIPVPIGVTSANSTSYIVNGLAPGESAWFGVRAVNDAGGSQIAWTLARTRPVVPKLNQIIFSGTDTELKWDADEGADGYRINRWDSTGQKSVVYGYAGRNTTHVVRGRSSGQWEYFQIEAFNSAGSATTQWMALPV